MKKAIIVSAASLIAIVLAFLAGSHFTDIEYYFKDVHEITPASVEDVIEPSENLVTASYLYTAAESYEKSRSFYDWTLPFTTTTMEFTYSGTVNVGFDMKALEIADVNTESRTITLGLPEASIISVEIDPSSYSYEYESQSRFTDFTMDDIPDTMDSLKEKMWQKAASDSEFIAEAEKRGRKIIESILSESEETSGYKVVWKDEGGAEDDNEYSAI